jgi:dimethylglycine dehydrogenase
MLNRRGKLIGDFTVACAAPDRFLVFGAGAAERHHLRWFGEHLPEGGGVALRALGLSLAGLSIAGPRAREVLARVTDEDVSPAALRFLDVRPRMEIGPVTAMVGRISFTGDLGYEIWVPAEHQVALFEALWEAGRDFGMRPFGSRALLSLAREKGFGTWAREFRPIYGPEEAGLGRFVDLAKGEFIGREAAAEERRLGPARRRVGFAVEADTADAIGDEAVWLDGAVVGWVTSGGYCHHARTSYATGYVDAARLREAGEAAAWEIEILGERRRARLLAAPLFDPEGARMRG